MASTIDLGNVQGDILTGLPKKVELLYFFEIKHVNRFRHKLADLIPSIATSDDVGDLRKKISACKAAQQGHVAASLLNISFSAKGMRKMGVDADAANDAPFKEGQLVGAEDLGDAGKKKNGVFEPSWLDEFKQDIDGVLIICGDCKHNVDQQLKHALHILGRSVSEVIKIFGHTRPGKNDGKEHFGFQDGISNPTVEGHGEDLSKQGPVKPSVILLGHDEANPDPSWAHDGSFMAFRLLKQLVPEFNEFLRQNALNIPSDPSIDGATLLASRLTGRWPSGAPLQTTPLADDPDLAKDKIRNNHFFYDAGSQEKCPFAAHTRKMNPRGDLPDPQGTLDPHRVMRRGIQYGPEVTDNENSSRRTEEERGLVFICYQSSIEKGFKFLQRAWANNQNFPPTGAADPVAQKPGFDPLIGQNEDTASNIGVRTMTGHDPVDGTKVLDLGTQNWVVSQGGEYFFSPSLKVLREVLAAKEGVKDWESSEGEGEDEL